MNVEVFLQIMVNVFTREWKNIRGKRACFRQEFAMPFGAPRWLTAVLLLVSGLAFEAQALPITPFPEMNIEYLPAADEELSDSAFYSRYPYVVIIDEGEDPEIDDEYFYQYAASVIFKVSKTTIPADDKTVKELRETVFPRISRDSLKIVRVKMRGAASPEGSVALNQRLSLGRQKALYNFVKNYIDIPEGDSLVLETETEDYTYLYKRMMQDGDPDSERVKQLFDTYMPKQQYVQLENALKAIDGGRLWRRMLVTYFPSLRAARMVIVCQRKPVPPLPVPELDSKPLPEDSVVTPEPPVIPDTPIAPLPPVEPEPWVERYPRRELLSVKTNLLFYGAYMPGGYDRWCPIPNIAVEYYPLRGHFTYGASFDCPWWQNYDAHKYFQIRNYQVEARYYFRKGDIELRPEGKGAAFKGFYLQAYGHVGVFGICLDSQRGWEGEALGGGIGAGYVLPLSKKGHWRLEFQLQAGVLFGGYDPYQFENPVNPAYRDHLYYYDWTGSPSLFKKRQHRFSWIGPTRIGITLSYDLLYRKARKKTDGVKLPAGTEPTKRYNPLVPYEKGGRP